MFMTPIATAITLPLAAAWVAADVGSASVPRRRASRDLARRGVFHSGPRVLGSA